MTTITPIAVSSDSPIRRWRDKEKLASAFVRVLGHFPSWLFLATETALGSPSVSRRQMTRRLTSLTRARARALGASHTSTHQQKASHRQKASPTSRARYPPRTSHRAAHRASHRAIPVQPSPRRPCSLRDPVLSPCSTWCSTPRRRPSHVRKFCRRAKPRLRAWRPTGSRSAWSSWPPPSRY